MLIVKRISYYGASRVAVALGQFLLLPVAVVQIGVANYGVYNLIMQGAMLIRLIALQAVAQTIIREHDLIVREYGTNGAYSNGLIIVMLNLFVVSFLVLLFSEMLTSQFGFSVQQIWLLLVMSVVATLFGLKQSIVYSSDFITYCKSDVVQPLSVIIFSILFAIYLPRVETYLVIYIVVTIVTSFTFFNFRFEVKSLHGNLRKFAGLIHRYGLPLMLGEIFGWIISVSDRFQIAAQLDVTQTGVYAAAYQLFVTPIALVGVTIATVIQSVVMTCSVEKFRSHMNKSATVTFMVSFAYLLCVLLFGEFVLSTVLRNKISVDLLFLLVLASAGIANSFYQLELVSGKYARKSGIILFAQACGGILILWGNWIFLPIMGIMAAAITSLLAYILQIIILRLVIGGKYYFSYFSLQSSIEVLSRLWAYIRK
jgi:O-antigen/teichoic acid export membrane protein